MRKAKRVLIALFLGIVTVFGVAGCNDGTQNKLQGGIDGEQSQIEEMNYSVVYEDVSYDWLAGRKNFVEICNSNNDLIELCTENNCGFYDNENPDYESALGNKVREYTEEFFKSKSIVVCSFIKSSYSGPLKVSSLEVVENTLTLKIKRPDSDIADSVVVCWGFIIEVDKSIVSVVTDSTYLVI